MALIGRAEATGEARDGTTSPRKHLRHFPSRDQGTTHPPSPPIVATIRDDARHARPQVFSFQVMPLAGLVVRDSVEFDPFSEPVFREPEEVRPCFHGVNAGRGQALVPVVHRFAFRDRESVRRKFAVRDQRISIGMLVARARGSGSTQRPPGGPKGPPPTPFVLPARAIDRPSHRPRRMEIGPPLSCRHRGPAQGENRNRGKPIAAASSRGPRPPTSGPTASPSSPVSRIRTMLPPSLPPRAGS